LSTGTPFLKKLIILNTFLKKINGMNIAFGISEIDNNKNR